MVVRNIVIMATINKEVIDAFVSTLQDLTVNSKPLINVLTMIADENEPYSKNIVEAIETHLSKVRLEVKLPILYLIDCIIKNVGRSYTQHFCQNIVSTFCGVFEVVDEKTRAEMFKLRQTWNDVLPKAKLYAMDLQIRKIDPAWPITSHLHSITTTNTIHVNPRFLNATANSLKKDQQQSLAKSGLLTVPAATQPNPATLVMQQKLLSKQKELVELQQKKIELELLQTKVKLEEEKLKSQLVSTKSTKTTDVVLPTSKSHNLLLKPEVAKQLDNGSDETTTIKSNSKIGSSNAHSSASLHGSYPAVIQSYTIPKQQQAVRYGAASSRDPRLLRLQQQQATETDTTTTIIRAPLEIKKGIIGNPRNSGGASNTLMKPSGGRLPNKHNSGANKRLAKYNKSLVSLIDSNVNKPPKKRNLLLVAELNSLNQQEQQKTARSKNISSSNTKNIFINASPPTSIGSDSTTTTSSSGGSPTKQRQVLLDESNVEDDVGGKFRDLKGANKRRNYVRRNNNRQQQQQQQLLVDQLDDTGQVKEVVGDGRGGNGGDVDLRSLDSFGVVVGGGSINSKMNQSPKLDVALKSGDVDLRQIPASNVDKKRSGANSDNADSPPTKKSKSQVLDALFGSEDVDLRQSTVPTPVVPRVTTPPPPPPPIISSVKSMSSSILPTDHHREEQVQAVQPTQSTAAPSTDSRDVKKANLDALRAKLASVSNKEKLKEQKRKQTKQDIVESTPLPVGAETLESAIIRKIIMSSDDVDSIRAGKLSKEQENTIMAKIKSHFENEKLAQAKLKEKEEQEDEQKQQQQGQSERHDDHEISDDDEVVEVLSQSNDLPMPPVPAGPLLGAGGRFPPRTRGGRAHTRAQQSGRSGSNRWGPATNTTAGTGTPWPAQGNGKGGGRWGGPTNHIIPPPPIPPLASVDYNLMQQQEQQEPPQSIILQCTNPDDARSINIDGCPRDIRFYEQTAIVFMSWDDPREISFQHGARRAIFDDSGAFLLQLNETEYTNVAISGQMHRIRLGAPTRELWIDGNYYEAIFGGKQIALEIDGRVAMVQLEGPPPQVRIGTERRVDLVAGKIQIIVDAKIIIPVFLDARVQQIVFGSGQVHQLQFVDRLRAVRFDGGAPFPVEFGGLPKAVHLKQRKHFVRFSVLPRGVRPGLVRIQGMDGSDADADIDVGQTHFYEPTVVPVTPMPHIPSAEELAGVPVAPAAPLVQIPTASMDESSLDSQHNLGGNFDALSNAINVSLNTSASEYHVESQLNNPHSALPQSLSVTSAADSIVQQPVQPQLSNVLNINDLFQKLIATGIVTTLQPQEPRLNVVEKQPQQHKTKRKEHKNNPATAEIPAPVLLPIQWNKPNSLKTRQTGLVQLLYSGLQCNSCGERFPPAAGGSRLFSQHLDWHFRQNRRGKNSARNRKATSRRWYYSLADWKQYEEIEDLKERAEKNFFENQQQQQEEGGETTTPSQDAVLFDQHQHGSTAADFLSSVAADPDTTDPHCVVCEDRFEQFYNEELEEWHLRNAVAVDGQIYHPICYKDQQSKAQTSGEPSSIPGLDMMVEQEGKDVEMDGNSSGNSVEEIQVIDDDADDEEEAKKQEETPELELIVEENITETEEDTRNDIAEDDDVILNEVQPEQIILDEYQWRGPEPTEDELLAGLIPGVVVKIEPIDDGFMDVGDSLQKAQEPFVKYESKQLEQNRTEQQFDLVDDLSTVGKEAAINSGETMVVDDDDHQQQNKANDEAAVIIEEDVDVDMGQTTPQQHQAEQMMASIDGNIDMNNKIAPTSIGPVAILASSGRIRINISKSHSKGNNTSSGGAATEQQQQQKSEQTAVVATNGDIISCSSGDMSVSSVSVAVDPSQPLPPGEETPLKPALRGLTLRRQSPVHTGTELTGLCSIM